MTEPAHPTGTVLIVEDVETCADTLELALSGLPGIEISHAWSAIDALKILDERTLPVCAVVTDLNMPRMDGFELIRIIRADSRHARLPIIVTSADTDPRTPGRTYAVGADAYFSKPYSPVLLRQKLEQLLHAKETHDA